MKHTKHRLAAILLGIGMLFSASASVHAQSQWMDKVTLYFPNRVLDLLDVFSLNIGVGLTAHASLRATHEVEIGGGFSATAQMIKDYNRQYGFARRNGVYSGMGFLNAATVIAPFMPIECYSVWLIDGTFGGPGAQGVTGKNQRSLLGGSQYSNILPTFLGTWLGTGSVRWIYGNAYGSTTYLLETYGLDKGLGDAGVRRLITEFRARLALPSESSLSWSLRP